ncbi:Nose resistant to fluoxetine protein 6 [Eumeta japonica]|uniref:Nose resistant to fluoxetine protein 6 n=1 Tax=Eumeta variegata TaxID=151549 RepID=A0A4C1WA45_EUMVA|nr:Nose resistant to fluoxetine protein 6 [Eumeta japonica]
MIDIKLYAANRDQLDKLIWVAEKFSIDIRLQFGIDKLFDASAKSPQGLLFGSSYHLGNFDECVGIADSAVETPLVGQYCLATIHWPEADYAKKIRTGRGGSLRWAVCVPGACDPAAVQRFVGDVLSRVVGNTTRVTVQEKDCYTRQPLTVTNLDVAFFYALDCDSDSTFDFDHGFVFNFGSGTALKPDPTSILNFASHLGHNFDSAGLNVEPEGIALVLYNRTMYPSCVRAGWNCLALHFDCDWFPGFSYEVGRSFILLFAVILFVSTIYEVVAIRRSKSKGGILHDLVVSFSMLNNMKKILSTKQNNKLGLECIAGMKTLAMVFITAGHACLFIASGPVMDADAWDRLVRQPANAFMLNNALLVDTFLMLSAFLFCRLLLLELDKRRGRLNVIPILVFRYIRVTPAYLVVIIFYMSWLPKIGEGPLWDERLKLEQERCQASWWANILYINNYVNTDQLCMFQSWYLSVDTQLFFVAPFFIYSLWRWRRAGPTFLGAGLLLSLLVPSVITFERKWDPTLLFYANYRFSKSFKVCAWFVSVTLGVITTFSVSVFYQPWYHYSASEAAAYISLHKLAWGIANGWLIIACATGNGGILGMFLTWSFWLPISRLTFCAYLVNGIVELYYVGTLRHPLHISFFNVSAWLNFQMANAIAHITLTFLLALLLCLTFESPIHGIEKILLRCFARPVLSDNAKRESDCGETSRNTSQSKLDS